MPKKIKPLETLTKLEQEKQTKTLIGEELDKLSVLGQESERKAAKWVKEEGKETREKEKKKTDNTLDTLDFKRKSLFTYEQVLLAYIHHEMKTFDIPKGFHWHVKQTKQGMLFIFVTPTGKAFARGTQISRNPTIDINAVTRFLFDAVDQMDHIAEELEKKKEEVEKIGGNKIIV